MAWTYDLVAWVVSLGMWKDWVLSIAPEISGPRVLELGYGPGHLQINLLSKGVSTFGLDKSAQMVRKAKRRINSGGFGHRLVNGNSQQLPFPEHCFDQVAATFPTEYILQPDTLSEIYRVLTPEGKLMVVPVAWITGSKAIERAAAALFRVTGQAGEWDEKYLHPLNAAGFVVEVKRVELKSTTVLHLIAHKQ